MKLVYAPSFRESQDILHANVLCGYDISVLECLLEANKKKGGGGRMKSSIFQTLKPRNLTIKSF